jgi:peptidoglycan/LPS O-acetylase OafA/YrhL
MTTSFESPAASQMPFLDAVKAAACLLIVIHHLSAYAPMSDAVHAIAPGLIDVAFDYGRLAVQVFLVLGGFLMAKSLLQAPQPGSRSPGAFRAIDSLRMIARRYRRLAMPFMAAMALAILCAAVARSWVPHETFPLAPTAAQILAHALLLQDLVGQPALSAGAWYVAVDLQLFALSVLALAVGGWLGRALNRTQGLAEPVRHAKGWERVARIGGKLGKVAPPAVWLIGLLGLASLLHFNRDPQWDSTALYFFGSYGLGALAWWVGQQPRVGRGLAVIVFFSVLALIVDFRIRIAVAVATALFLVLAQRRQWLYTWEPPSSVRWLGQISYSVFLAHFPLCMLVNALFSLLYPDSPWANLVGMALAVAISLYGGALFFRFVERPAQQARLRPALYWAGTYGMVGWVGMLDLAAVG